MAKVSELISLIDVMMPSATSNSDKIRYMNMGQDALSDQFGLVITNSSLFTVSGTDEYDFPTGITDISQIEDFGIGYHVPIIGAIPERDDITRYKIGYADVHPNLGNCIYQNYSSTGKKSFVICPKPAVTGLQITIRYHAKLTDLSVLDLDKIPEFDSRYHNLLAVFACHQICANGPSPDTIQANRFASSFNDGLLDLREQSYRQQIAAPKKPTYNKLWNRR